MNKDKKIEYKGQQVISDVVISTTNKKLFLALAPGEYIYGLEQLENSQIVFCLSKNYLSEYEEDKLKGYLSEVFQIKDEYINLHANDINDFKTKIFEQNFFVPKGNYELHKIVKDNVNYGILIKPSTIIPKSSNTALDSNAGELIGDVASDGILDFAGDLIGGIIDGIFSS